MPVQLNWERYWTKSRRTDQESSAMQVIVWQTPREDIRRQRKRHWCSQGLRKVPSPCDGVPFDLVADHKPLEVVYGPRSKACSRIERWVVWMQQYKFKVKYEPGPSNIADPLSRLVGNLKTSSSHSAEAEEYVRFVAINATLLCYDYTRSGRGLRNRWRTLCSQGTLKWKTVGSASFQKIPPM